MSTNFSIIAIIFLASSGFMVASASIEGPTGSLEATPHQKYLENCASKITEKCGEVLFSSIFKNGSSTSKCCLELVAMGKECHTEMAKFIVSLPEYKEKAPIMLLKSEQIWDKCVVIAASPSSAPSPSS